MGVLSFVQRVINGEITSSEVSIRIWKKFRLNFGQSPYLYSRHFARLYREKNDPWDYETSDHAQTYYQGMLQILPPRRFRKILEIGCSVGVFTKMLAPLGENILAVDISPLALERARRRCGGLPHIRFQRLDVLTEPLMETFDLIFCTSVLGYYVDIPKKDPVCQKIIGGMEDGGYLVLLKDLQKRDIWWELFDRNPQLTRIRESSETGISLFRKKSTGTVP